MTVKNSFGHLSFAHHQRAIESAFWGGGDYGRKDALDEYITI